MNCGTKKYIEDHRSFVRNLSSFEIKPENKIRPACTGFEPMTSAIPRQLSPYDHTQVGLLAQAARMLHWYRRDHGFESRTGPKFFSGYIFRNCSS